LGLASAGLVSADVAGGSLRPGHAALVVGGAAAVGARIDSWQTAQHGVGQGGAVGQPAGVGAVFD
jgi:hypothetical protein